MDRINSLIIYAFRDNVLISKKLISFDIYSKWTSISSISNIIKTENFRIKYFDEEGELISIVDNADFLAFQNIVLKKKFVNNEVMMVVYDKYLDRRKYGSMKKLCSLKVHKERRDSRHEFSSGSSSSFELNKSKKYRSIKRYTAEIRKELNYLPGSEISDGQTIIKKWRIKNTGTKKWKANSVKCVILPSEFSSWVTYENVKVPVCFADQKVDIEMEIKIVGKWTEEQLSSSNCYQNIKLKWLLFMDKLVKESENNYLDFILLQLDFAINVKFRNHETEVSETLTSNLQKQTSESSIEKIDQDFSIVDISDDEIKKVSLESLEKNSVNKIEITNEALSEADIELPDCPNADDFQITDFIQPNSNNFVLCDDKKPAVSDKDNSLNNLLSNAVILPDIHLSANAKDIQEIKSFDDPFDKFLSDTENSIRLKENGEEVNNLMEHESNCIVFDGNNPPSDEVKSLESGVESLLDTENIEEANIIFENKDDHQISENINQPNSDIILDSKQIDQLEENVIDSQHVIHVDHQSIDDIATDEITNIEDEIKSPNYISHNNNLINDNANQSNLENSPERKADHFISNEKQSTENTFKPNESKFYIKNDFQKPILDEPRKTTNIDSTSFTINQQPYQAGVNPGNFVHNQIGCFVKSPPYPTQNTYFGVQNPRPYIPGAPLFPMSHVPIQNQSSDKIVQDLAKNGNIHNNINDAMWTKSPTGQHYDMTQNMERLKQMGFADREKNFRLLTKFGNNIQDVINELVD